MTATHAFDDPLTATLDVRTVGQLRSIPGRAGSLFDDLAPVFLRTSATQLDRIAHLVATGAHVAAAEAAFQLVGACGSFGAGRMCAAAARLRDALRSGDPSLRADAALDLLRGELDDVEAAIARRTVRTATICPRPDTTSG